jgi:hypothetical protein
MKQIVISLILVATLMGCKENQGKSTEDSAAADSMEIDSEEAETAGDWKVLFDGSSFDGWKGYQQDGVPEHWKLEEGAMVFYPPKNRPEGESYNLVSERSFTSFVLSLEWKISEGGNSGIMWGVREDEKYRQPYETGPEIQVLDNEKHPDAKAGTTHQSGALYDMVAPSRDVTNPVGEWNTCVITVDYEAKRGSVELNGEKIVEFPVADELWNVMVSKSKFADWEGFGKFTEGKIALQDHGDMVAFRNIKIKEL